MKIEDKKIYAYIDNGKLKIEKIIQDYSNYISTIIRNSYINLSSEDMEEVLLDVFVVLWKNQYKLDINKSLSAYISGVTKNLIKYKYRQNRPNQNIDEYEEKLIDFVNMELFLEKSEKQKIISDELDKMKKEDKEVFVEYYYDERSIKEIASIFDLSESKVKSKLFRVRKRLNKELKKRGYSSDE